MERARRAGVHAIHATNNVETTLAFYTEIFGVKAEVRPFENPAVPILTDSPGVKLRVAMLRFPGHGFNFELTEFTNVPRTPAQPAVVDPGAPHMKVLVRDLKPVLAGLDKVHATIVTRSTKPVRVKTAQLGAVDAIMNLAKIESRVTLAHFLGLPTLERDGPPTFRSSVTVRRLATIPVKFKGV